MPERALRALIWLVPATLAATGFGGALAAWASGGWSVDVPWAPTLGLRFAFALDGLGILYALLATGVGLAVFVYSAGYLPGHLERHHERATPWLEARFAALLVLFMVSMVGLVTAQDLVLLFVFWDLTAVSSYFLIGFDRHERPARVAALMALLVTGISAVFLLVAVLLLHGEYGTFALPAVLDAAETTPVVTAAGALVLAAGLAKSAQVPFHFWLPRAMIAPTPVSAYLHSAAMVAAGVFLLTRLHPLVAAGAHLQETLVVVGAASMVFGGLMALVADELKQVLAYSTIAQYGYVTFLLGLPGEQAVAAACFYVLAHAAVKSGLFLTAGAVAETAGEHRLSRVGGLGRARPALAAAAALLAAGLAALPLTIGFFKDELFFAVAWEAGPAPGAVAVAGAAITLAYAWRFWSGIFLGPGPGPLRAVPASVTGPVLALAAVSLLGGVVVGPFNRLAEAAGEAAVGARIALDPHYTLGLEPALLMALLAYAVGAGLAASSRRTRPVLVRAARTARRFGPERSYRVSLAALNRLSDSIHDLEVRDLRTRVAAVLVPGGALVLLGFFATPTQGSYRVGAVTAENIPLVIVLLAAAVAAVAATVPRAHVALVLVLSASGLGLAVVYALLGAPDVALVAVLVETVLVLLFFGVLALLPSDVLRREAAVPESRRRRRRDPVIALAASGLAFVVVWGALSRPAPSATVAQEHLRRAPDAHAQDVVTAILADFRGLDTVGEISVVVVALLGVATMLAGGRLWARSS